MDKFLTNKIIIKVSKLDGNDAMFGASIAICEACNEFGLEYDVKNNDFYITIPCPNGLTSQSTQDEILRIFEIFKNLDGIPDEATVFVEELNKKNSKITIEVINWKNPEHQFKFGFLESNTSKEIIPAWNKPSEEVLVFSKDDTLERYQSLYNYFKLNLQTMGFASNKNGDKFTKEKVTVVFSSKGNLSITFYGIDWLEGTKRPYELVDDVEKQLNLVIKLFFN